MWFMQNVFIRLIHVDSTTHLEPNTFQVEFNGCVLLAFTQYSADDGLCDVAHVESRY